MGPPSFLKASVTRRIAVRYPGCLRTLLKSPVHPRVNRHAKGLSANEIRKKLALSDLWPDPHRLQRN